MATAAPIFYDDVLLVINLLLLVFALIVEGVAFVHCLVQRADAFPAIGTLPKGAWLAILGLCMFLTFVPVFGVGGSPISIFGLIGIAAGLIYLLDVRVGLRDLTDGKGFW